MDYWAFLRGQLAENAPGKLADRMFALLQEAIVTGKLAPGTKITTSALAQKLGISMTPIRDALSRLEETGLIVLQQNRGAYVSQFSEKDVEDLFYYRSVLERLAAQQAGERMTDEQHKALGLLAADVEEKMFLAGDDFMRSKEIAAADLAFHCYLVECSGNPLLIQRYRAILPKIRYIRQFIERTPVSATTFVEEHYLICLVLRTKTPEFIANVIDHHMHNHTITKAADHLK